MPPDVLLRCSPGERELAGEIVAALAGANVSVAAPDLGGASVESSAARLCLILVTRAWTSTPGLLAALAEARAAAQPVLLAWWDEDAPSDFLGEPDNHPSSAILYLCFLPRPERATRLVARVVERLGRA